MRTVAVAIVVLMIGGLGGMWVTSAGLIPAHWVRLFESTDAVPQTTQKPAVAQPTAPLPAKADLTRERAAQIIVAALSNSEVLTKIGIGYLCAMDARGGCMRASHCPSSMSISDAIQYASAEMKTLLRDGMISRVELRETAGYFANQPGGYNTCYYDFALADEAARLVRGRWQGNRYSQSTVDVVAYNKKFLGITGVMDIDDRRKSVEYLVKFEPTSFAKIVLPSWTAYRDQNASRESALFARYDDGWRLVEH